MGRTPASILCSWESDFGFLQWLGFPRQEQQTGDHQEFNLWVSGTWGSTQGSEGLLESLPLCLLVCKCRYNQVIHLFD